MTSTWGSSTILQKLRMVFRGHELPADATPADILHFVDKSEYGSEWNPVDVQFVGPGAPQDPIMRKDRITLVFGVIADGRRVIEDFSIG